MSTQTEQHKPLPEWVLTLYPLAVLYQWSRSGTLLVTLGAMLQVALTLGAMLLIARLPAALTDAAQLGLVLAGVIALLYGTQLLDMLFSAFGRVVAADVERFHEDKVLDLALQRMSQLEFELPQTQDFFNQVRGREMGGMMVRQFVLAALEVFSIRLTGFVALVATAWVAWYLPLLILPALVAIRLWLKAETRVLGDSFRKSGEGLRRSAYFRRLLLEREALAELLVFGRRGYVHELFVGAWQGAMNQVWEARRGRRAKVVLVGLVVAASIGTALALQVLAVQAGNLALAKVLFLAQVIPACIPMAFSGHGEIIIAQGGAILGKLGAWPRPRKTGKGTDAPAALPAFERVVLEQVRFRYPGADTDVLQGIDLDIRRGESIGIVGTNGAGKSTLIKVLTGLFEPTEGRVLLDGTTELDTASPAWRNAIEYVPQIIGRIPGTVLQLVSRFEAEPDVKAVHRALRKVGADKFVYALKDGLQTHIGDQGLSGGQEQLLALAQAYYKEERGGWKLRVLDEPTAALSGAREKEIFDLLLSAREADADDSLILVTHRLGGVRRADRIVVIDEGRVVETGSHDELMRRPDSRYRRMYEQQAEPYLDETAPLLKQVV